MNKAELIDHIAMQADISKAAATRALEALIGGVVDQLGFVHKIPSSQSYCGVRPGVVGGGHQ